MAVTAPDLQAALSTSVNGPRVWREVPPYGGTLQYWYVSGGFVSASNIPKGRMRFVSTTASDNAATQAAAVVTALAAGPTHQ